MNTFTKLTSIIGVIVVLFVSLIGTAESTHLYNGWRWIGTTIKYCHDYYLKNVYIDGSRSMEKAGSEINAAVSHINGLPSKWTFSKLSVTSCLNPISSAKLDDLGYTLATTYHSHSTTPGIIYAERINFNTSAKFTSGSCINDSPWKLKYVALHELGHWVEMEHGGTDSVMYKYFNCDSYSKFHSHDSATISSIYGS